MATEFDVDAARIEFETFDILDQSQPFGGMLTTSSWNGKEDYDLCYIYCSLSLDPVRGADQSGETFWGRITNAYNRKNMDRNRSVASIKGRYCKINRQTQCFDSQMFKLKQSNPSGFGSDTHMRIAANKLFKQIYKPDSKQGPHFYQFMHVYDLLVNHVKWKSSLQKSVQDVQSSCSRGKSTRFGDSCSPRDSQDSATMGLEEDAERYERPEGSKAAKKKQVAGGNDGEIRKLLKESNDMFMSALQSRNIHQQEKLEAIHQLVETKRRKEEDAVMFTDISQMDDVQREYTEYRRFEILRRRREGM